MGNIFIYKSRTFNNNKWQYRKWLKISIIKKNSDKQMLYTYIVNQEEKTKENGIYKMLIGKNPFQVVEVSGEGIEENKTIDIYNYR